MKIAIAGIATESCTFSSLPTRLEDFRVHREEDPEFLMDYPSLVDYPDATFVPLLRARAMPGGPVERAAYDALKGELVERLQAGGPWDGVFLDMHGAMNVAGLDDAEGDWYAAVRNAVGEDCLISASYDLHGNISARIVHNLDMLTAFRTAPHVDYMETRARAIALLVRCLRDGVRPVMRWVPVPVILPGERTSTEWEPGQSIYAQIPEIIAQTGVLDASMLVGYVWADEPRTTASAIAVAADVTAADRASQWLAQLYWEARDQFDFGVPTFEPDICIQQAMQATDRPVFISDSGDNPTAGGVGDVPYMLARLLALEVPDAVYASIPDAAAMDVIQAAGVGQTVTLSLGGKLDPVNGQPLTVTGEIVTLLEGENPQAVVKVDGVRVIVTQRRKPFHYEADFQALGIEPTQHALVVVKIGYLVPDLKRMARTALLALSPGAVNQDIVRLPYQRLTRPIYPLDPETTL